MTLGFAVTGAATPLGLGLGGTSGSRFPAPTTPGQPRPSAALDDAGDLEVSRGARALAELAARRMRLHAAARAEAAAHDASARADALARRLASRDRSR